MRSCLNIARAFNPFALVLFLVAGSAAHTSAGEPGDTKGDDPIEGRPFVWTETRDVFEFAGKEPRGRTKRDQMKRDQMKRDLTKRDSTKRDPTKRDQTTPSNLTREELILKVRTEAEECAIRAEDLLAEREYSAVVDATVEALSKIKGVQLPAPLLSERLRRAQETARRMNERAEIEQEFNDLQITIGGVAWSRTSPVALINGEIKRPGESVSGARIEEIRKHAVVFSLKGVRVRRVSGASSGE